MKIEELTIGQLKKALSEAGEADYLGVCDSRAPEPIQTHIVVLDRGFVYVGNPQFSETGDDMITLTNARNIRSWGTSKGLGELVNGPLSSTKLDDVGTIVFTKRALIHMIVCKKNW